MMMRWKMMRFKDFEEVRYIFGNVLPQADLTRSVLDLTSTSALLLPPLFFKVSRQHHSCHCQGGIHPLTHIMSAPITLRNLTAQPLTLKLVERYQAPNPKDFPPNAGFSNFTTFFSNTTNSSQPKSAQTFTHEDVEIRMEPFTTHKTDIKASERGPNDILRLTVQGDGLSLIHI